MRSAYDPAESGGRGATDGPPAATDDPLAAKTDAAGLPGDALEIAVEVGRIAAMPGSAEERARALLGPLRRLTSFNAAALVALDPEQHEFVTLASAGYDEATRAYLNSRALYEDVGRVGLDVPSRPMRLCDIPVPRAELRGWTDYLAPRGFREGFGVGLFRADGSPLGLFTGHTRTAVPPSEAIRDLLGALAPTIAHAVDPMRSISALARIVTDALAGVVLTRSGHALPLPGLPSHPLLRTGSAVLAAAARALREGHHSHSFHCPYRTAAGDGHRRISVLSCAASTGPRFDAVVLLSPAGDLYGLTRRELEILGLLIEGWSNQRIAASLYIAERTVAAHVEHILAKLATPTRTLAAVRALRTGLYVPRSLYVAA